MPLPAIAAGIFAGSKLLGGFLKGKQKKARAEAQKKAIEEQKKQFEAGQVRRSAKLGGVNQALQNVGGALPAGAPDYSFDPETLAAMQKALPFAGEADPTKGTGYGLAGELTGAAGDLALDYLAGPGAAGAPAPRGVEFSPDQIVTGQEDLGGDATAIDWDAILKGSR